jgi:hypothetical protein
MEIKEVGWEVVGACMWLTIGTSGVLDDELLGSIEGEKLCNELE